MDYGQFPYQRCFNPIPSLPYQYPSHPRVNLVPAMQGWAHAVVAHSLHTLQQSTGDAVGLWLFNVVMENNLNNNAFGMLITTVADVVLLRFVQMGVSDPTEEQMVSCVRQTTAAMIPGVAAVLMTKHNAGYALQQAAQFNPQIMKALNEGIDLINNLMPSIKSVRQMVMTHGNQSGNIERTVGIHNFQGGSTTMASGGGGGFGDALFNDEPVQQETQSYFDSIDTWGTGESVHQEERVSDFTKQRQTPVEEEEDFFSTLNSVVERKSELPPGAKTLDTKVKVIYPENQPYPMVYNPRIETICYIPYRNGFIERRLEVPMDVETHRLTTPLPDSINLPSTPEPALTEDQLRSGLDKMGLYQQGFITEEEFTLEINNGLLNLGTENTIEAESFPAISYEVDSILESNPDTSEEVALLVYSGCINTPIHANEQAAKAVQAMANTLESGASNRLATIRNQMYMLRQNKNGVGAKNWNLINKRLTDRFCEALRYSMNNDKARIDSFTDDFNELMELLERKLSDSYPRIIERHAADIFDNALNVVYEAKDNMLVFQQYFTVVRIREYADKLPLDFTNPECFGAVTVSNNEKLFSILRSTMQLNPLPSGRVQDYFLETGDGLLFRIRNGWLTNGEASVLIHRSSL